MTQLSLYSLARVSRRLPRLVVAFDPSTTGDEVRGALAFWPEPIALLDGCIVADEHEIAGSGLLAEFTRRHVFGFKLGACLHIVKTDRLLYADADVLWFWDPCLLMQNHQLGAVWGSEDCYPSYNARIVSTLGDDQANLLAAPPFVNAGVAIYNSVAIAPTLAPMLATSLEENPIHEFSEQTMVALLAKTTGGVMPAECVCVSCSDFSALRPSFVGKPWLARHYIRPARQQFWIDAAGLLLLGNRQRERRRTCL